MSVRNRIVIPAILSIVIIGIYYYATIPAINIKNVDFWWFLIFCIVVIAVCFGVPRLGAAGSDFFSDLGDRVQSEGWIGLFSFGKDRKHNAGSADDKRKRRLHSPAFWGVVLAVFLLLGIFIGSVASSPFFNARAYSNLLDVEEGDFSEDISEISMKSVPVVDRDTAVRLGSRTIGEMSDLVSQYAIDETSSAYTQINYQGSPYRVSPLIYADPIKWLMNTGQGLPGYVTVNMATQETSLVRLEEGGYIHYSTGEHFNKYLYRHVRFSYPFEMLGEASFEIDDDGHPYWIVPTIDMRIGLFGGCDYDGAILVDACTGEMQRYSLDEIPSWCDKVFNADLVYDQLGYYGKYRSGFWNSIIGQSGVLVPTGSSGSAPVFTSSTTSTGSTSGYNYLAIDDDVYMYTGMTSANSDESLVGFTLVNLRTKETSYYTCAGATESSAMSSAEGQVQQMSYVATSPLLLNIADRPTYFLSLKDDAGLVKMYAFIDVQQYQIVGTGSTVTEAQQNYIAALSQDEQVDVDTSALVEDVELPTTTGIIQAIQPVVVDGNTIYYIMLVDDENVYTVEVSVSEKLPFFAAGDTVEVTYTQQGSVREISTLSTLGSSSSSSSSSSSESSSETTSDSTSDNTSEST